MACDACPICHEAVGDDAFKPPCGCKHSYHYECMVRHTHHGLQRALTLSAASDTGVGIRRELLPTCPTCRAQLVLCQRTSERMLFFVSTASRSLLEVGEVKARRFRKCSGPFKTLSSLAM